MQSDQLSFNVGDVIIRSGHVHQIITVDKRIRNDQEEKIIKYKAYFEVKYHMDLTYTTPTDSLETLHIRKPIAKSELKGLLKELSQTNTFPAPIDIKKVGEQLHQNDPFQTASLLKSLWYEKHTDPEKFNMKKQQIMEQAIKYLVQEIAYINQTTVEKAQEQLNKELPKLPKKAD